MAKYTFNLQGNATSAFSTLETFQKHLARSEKILQKVAAAFGTLEDESKLAEGAIAQAGRKTVKHLQSSLAMQAEADSKYWRQREKNLDKFVERSLYKMRKLSAPTLGKASTLLAKAQSTLYNAPGDIKEHIKEAKDIMDILRRGDAVFVDGQNATMQKMVPILKQIVDLELKELDIQRKKNEEIKKQNALKKLQREQRREGTSASDFLMKQFDTADASPQERAKLAASIGPIQRMINDGKMDLVQFDHFFQQFVSGQITSSGELSKKVFASLNTVMDAYGGMGAEARKAAKDLEKANKEAAKALREKRLNTVADRRTKQFEGRLVYDNDGAFKSGGAERKQALAGATSGIRGMLAEGKVAYKDVMSMWEKFKQGKFKATTDTERTLLRHFKTVNKILKDGYKTEGDIEWKAYKDKLKNLEDARKVRLAKISNQFVNKHVVDPAMSGDMVKNANRAEINKMQAAATSLQGMIEKGNVGLKRAKYLWDNYGTDAVTAANKSERALLRAIGTVKTAERGLGAEHKRIADKAAADTARAVKEIESRSIKAILTIGSTLRLLYIQYFHMVLGRATHEIFDLARKAMELQKTVSAIRTISQDSPKTVGDWQKEITSVSAQFGLDELDVAKGAYEAISNQVVDAGNALQFMADTGKFAKATLSSMAEAVDLTSAAINSFGLTVDDTDKILAQQFATIDLGKVKAGELANVYGRVAPVAGQLGVKMEELNAMFAMFSIRGVPTSEVATQISGVMQKMLKPTKELREVYAEWGVESGKSAIKAFGFLGVLKKLNDELDKNPGKEQALAEIMNEVRGFRGATQILTPEGLIEFERTTAQIANSMPEYTNAIAITFDNTASKIEKKLGEVREYLYAELIYPALEGIDGVTGSVGKMDNALNNIKATLLGADVGKSSLLSPFMVGSGLFVGLKILPTMLDVTGRLLVNTAASTSAYVSGVVNGLSDIETKQLAVQRGYKGMENSAERWARISTMSMTLAAASIGAVVMTIMAAREKAELEAKQASANILEVLKRQADRQKEIENKKKRDYEQNSNDINVIVFKNLEKQTKEYLQHSTKIQGILNKLKAEHERLAATGERGFKKMLTSVGNAYDAMIARIERSLGRLRNVVEASKDNAENINERERQRQYERERGKTSQRFNRPRLTGAEAAEAKALNKLALERAVELQKKGEEAFDKLSAELASGKETSNKDTGHVLSYFDEAISVLESDPRVDNEERIVELRKQQLELNARLGEQADDNLKTREAEFKLAQYYAETSKEYLEQLRDPALKPEEFKEAAEFFNHSGAKNYLGDADVKNFEKELEAKRQRMIEQFRIEQQAKRVSEASKGINELDDQRKKKLQEYVTAQDEAKKNTETLNSELKEIVNNLSATFSEQGFQSTKLKDKHFKIVTGFEMQKDTAGNIDFKNSSDSATYAELQKVKKIVQANDKESFAKESNIGRSRHVNLEFNMETVMKTLGEKLASIKTSTMTPYAQNIASTDILQQMKMVLDYAERNGKENFKDENLKDGRFALGEKKTFDERTPVVAVIDNLIKNLKEQSEGSQEIAKARETLQKLDAQYQQQSATYTQLLQELSKTAEGRAVVEIETTNRLITTLERLIENLNGGIPGVNKPMFNPTGLPQAAPTNTNVNVEVNMNAVKPEYDAGLLFKHIERGLQTGQLNLNQPKVGTHIYSRNQ